tara:strand:- start:2499 stop:3155 length:657 start_codon:yes stop_codon:yes gene_type:complete
MPEINTAGGAFPEETQPFNEADQAILEGREPQEEGSEELIGGKFKSADDLLQAYQELEKKLGNQDQVEEVPQDTQYESEDQDVEAGDIIGGVEQVPLSEAEESQIIETIGGEEGLDVMADWAKDNLDQDEIKAYNQEVNSGDFTRARNALQSMYFAMQQSQGQEPELISGRLSSNSTDVYRSVQEVEAAMNDPRYLHDTAYTRDVEEKVSRSNVLTPR